MIGSAHPLATKYEESAKAFRRLFPNRFYYVDSTRGLSAGFHLIEGFFRDDQPYADGCRERGKSRTQPIVG
jgi:hypothetical protein